VVRQAPPGALGPRNRAPVDAATAAARVPPAHAVGRTASAVSAATRAGLTTAARVDPPMTRGALASRARPAAHPPAAVTVRAGPTNLVAVDAGAGGRGAA
jgi:hypothetical protein